MHNLLKQYPLILTEAAIVEQIRRTDPNLIHPQLLNAPLIYSEQGRKTLSQLYENYLNIAYHAHLPIMIFSPTWRSNHARVKTAKIDPDINFHATQFMNDIRSRQNLEFQKMIKIGGLVGPKNDCYQPQHALTTNQAEKFHQWQITSLVEGKIDFLVAQTLPNLDEATGVAKAMAKSNQEYMLSFVINRNGLLLDGHSLAEAIEHIDRTVHPKPIAYMINCSYPTFLNPKRQPRSIFDRLIGFQANASSLDHDQLENSNILHQDNLQEWQQNMLMLKQNYGFKILGGCCGTGSEYLSALVS